MRRVAIGQAGGPTAVINATLVGFVKEVLDESSLYFIKNGYEGLVKGNFIRGDRTILDLLENHANLPGACLGSGRYPREKKNIELSVMNLKKKEIDTLVIIGGNGSMEALREIKNEASSQGYDLQVIGLPKTVDNDLGGTDHAPGFGSAAKYVANTTRDISRDLHAMRNFEQVRILETMGRNAGWLAYASAFYKNNDYDGPHFIGIPEQPIVKENLINSVDAAVRRSGHALVVVSEGAHFAKEKLTHKKVVNGRTVLGGVSTQIENLISEKLGLSARGELLGMNQRSCSALVSESDRNEAYAVGIQGARFMKEGKTDIMVSMYRKNTSSYEVGYRPIALDKVISKGESLLMEYFIDDLPSYNKWLKPLIADSSNYPAPLITD